MVENVLHGKCKDSNNMNAQSRIRYTYEFTRIPVARYVTESWRLLRLRNWRVVKSCLLATRGIIGINRVGEMKIETEFYIVFLSFRTFIIRNCIIFLGSKTYTRNFARCKWIDLATIFLFFSRLY